MAKNVFKLSKIILCIKSIELHAIECNFIQSGLWRVVQMRAWSLVGHMLGNSLQCANISWICVFKQGCESLSWIFICTHASTLAHTHFRVFYLSAAGWPSEQAGGVSEVCGLPLCHCLQGCCCLLSPMHTDTHRRRETPPSTWLCRGSVKNDRSLSFKHGLLL